NSKPLGNAPNTFIKWTISHLLLMLSLSR
ncbi:hypothetical protein CA163_28910, partial [Vibrio parahaemolyticus]